MSRNNNVRGPTSALTEFLRESGITPTTIARRTRTRQVEAQPVAGPSNPRQNQAQNDAGAGDDENEEAQEYSSDHLDESEEERPTAKKRKLSKAAEAKLKAQEKAKEKAKTKKKGGDDDDYDDDEDEEDPYNALSKMWKDTSKPPVGSFEDCARCGKQFTVTKYTMAANPPPGFLCHVCAKASGADPFKKPAAPRKRKTPADKRTVVNFEERRFPSLASLCIQIITRHIDDVEALGDLDAINKDQLSKSLARNRSLTSENATLFYNVENERLTFYDATKLTPPTFSSLAMLNPNLVDLRLDYCGRIDDETFAAWTQGLPNLKRLELLGPFLVRPPAWQAFFKAHPGLEGFLITQSPRFDFECVRIMVDSCKGMKQLRLKEIGQMHDTFLECLKVYGDQLTRLELSYPGQPDSLTENALIDFIRVVGKNLTYLDLSHNVNITDGFLFQGLKPHASNLSTLILADLTGLTDAGVAEFFDTWHDAAEIPNPPLVEINFRRCPELSDKALTALIKHSGKELTYLNINQWRFTSQEVLKRIGLACPKLQKLDIGWCREADDWVIKEIMERCEHIQEIEAWGCQRLTVQCPRKRGVDIYGVEAHAQLNA
ncbi:RNI-like protein [Panus rudis PR-1116 ss-1]|nr:RNI-like protein [Panus rudis PR-1116 ss-1]